MEVKGLIVRSNLKTLVVAREIEERREITQEEIADAIQVRRGTVSKWLSPKTVFKMIDAEVLTKLAVYMHVPISDLLIVEYPESTDRRK